MGVHKVLILLGMLGAYMCLALPTGGTWSVDTEKTNGMNLEGITFFREEPSEGKQTDSSSSSSSSNSSNNNNSSSSDSSKNLSNIRGAIHTFSHFMPDQTKLSRTVGLANAAKKSARTVPDEINFLPPLYGFPGVSHRKNNVFNFAPTGDVKAPSTSEVSGFEAKSNQVVKIGTGFGREQNSDTFNSNAAKVNDNFFQEIDLSQLGIVTEDLGGAATTSNEIDYFNVGLKSRNVLNNANVLGENVLAGNTKFDTFKNMDNTINNNNNFIFDDTFSTVDTSKVSDANSRTPNVFSSGNGRSVVRSQPTGVSPPFDVTNDLSNAGNVFSSSGQGANDNIFQKGEKTEDIVKPFPFGQLQAKPKRLDKRIPTLTAKNDFVDHSRIPVLKVKSAFVDLSGRQNPNMKPLGTFVDMSEKSRLDAEEKVKTTIKTTSTPQTTPVQTKNTKLDNVKASNRPGTSAEGPMLTGLGLPGVVSIEPTQPATVPKSTTENMATDTNVVTNGKMNAENVNKVSGVSKTTEQASDNLKVDMLYPPAPFPVIDESKNNVNSNLPKTGKPIQTSRDVTGFVNENAADYTDVPGVFGNNGVVNDYDMYADVNTEGLTDNVPGVNANTIQQTNQMKQWPHIPHVLTNDDGADHFKTDPNVQVINQRHMPVANNNPSVPNAQNIDITNAQLFPNSIQNTPSNIQTGLANDQSSPSNMNGLPRNNPSGRNSFNNGQDNWTNQNIDQRIENTVLNQNQMRNGQTVQNKFPQNIMRSNGQSSTARIDQNAMPVNRLNPMLINQQNPNSFVNDRNVPTGFQNGKNNPNVIPDLPSNQNTAVFNTNSLTDAVQQNGQLPVIGNNQIRNNRPAQINNNANSIPFGSQPSGSFTNNQLNTVNAQRRLNSQSALSGNRNQIQNSQFNTLRNTLQKSSTNLQQNPNQIPNNQLSGVRKDVQTAGNLRINQNQIQNNQLNPIRNTRIGSQNLQISPNQIQNNQLNPIRNTRIGSKNLQISPNQIQNNQLNGVRNQMQNQGVTNLNNQIPQIQARPGMNVANAINNPIGANVANAFDSVSNVIQSRNGFPQGSANALPNNLQSGQIQSSGILNRQTPMINNIPQNVGQTQSTGITNGQTSMIDNNPQNIGQIQSNGNINGQTPMLNNNGQTPMLNNNGQTPMLNNNGQTPMLNNNGQPPMLNNNGQPPMLNNNGQPPMLNNNGQTPMLNNNGQTPMLNNNGQPPMLNNNGQPPMLNNNGQPPMLNNNGQASMLNNNGQTPMLNNNGQPPMLNNNGQPPMLNNNGQTPMLNNNGQPPMLNNNGQPPMLNNNGQPPMLNNNGQPPTLNNNGQTSMLNNNGQPPMLNNNGQPPMLNNNGQASMLNNNGQTPMLNNNGQTPMLNNNGQPPMLNNNGQPPMLNNNGLTPVLNNNGQTPMLNNIQRNFNTPLSNGNGLPNNFNVGGNAQTNLGRNGLASSQLRNNQMNTFGLRNGVQQISPNNIGNAPNTLQNGQNIFQNLQRPSFANVPRNFQNIINNMPRFQGISNPNNLPTNTFLRNTFQNGLGNNFRQNGIPNSLNVQRTNQLLGNMRFNTNQIGPNTINRPFT